jgi:hypothetical protein
VKSVPLKPAPLKPAPLKPAAARHVVARSAPALRAVASLLVGGLALCAARALSDDRKTPQDEAHAGHIRAEQEHAVAVPATLAARSGATRDARWWAPGEGRPFPAALEYPNGAGAATTLNLIGPTATENHPFFTPLGSNGRACITCHQPADGMSLALESIRRRWEETHGDDPLFAAVDGSNCPSLPQEQASSHSLLLERGLIRVFRPWPPKGPDGRAMKPQFTLEIMRDPTGCNSDPRYGLRSPQPMISVYRRPRPVTNVKYLTAAEFAFEPKTGLPLPIDPESSEPISGNLMADGRNPTLKVQAIEAVVTHLQAARAPSEATIAAIIDFERQLYSAQARDRWGALLSEAGARGGPQALAQGRAGELQSAAKNPIWNEFEAWAKLPAADAKGNAAQRAFRESVARGADIFAKRTFLIWDSAGVTSMGFGNPVRNSCAFCHNMYRTGLDVAPGHVDLGTTNDPFADPAPDLPLFKLTCKPGYRPHPHLGRVVYTQDPGFALTTGKCEDIGKITVQQMRGLAARAPYFSNGSARTLRAIVDYYERRYGIGLSEQDKQDLENLMSVL